MPEFNKTYINLQNIVDNMNVLFSELNLLLLDCDVAIPGGIILLLESLASSGTIEKNVAEIDRQLGDIVVGFKQSSDCDSTYIDLDDIDKCRSDSNNGQADKDKLFDAISSLSTDSIKSVFEDFNKNDTKSVAANDNASHPTSMSPENCLENSTKTIIMSMITLRDNLVLRRELIQQQQPDAAQQLNAVIDSILLETANALKQNKVTILDEKGTFNSSFQLVAGTEKTTDKSLDNVVSHTLRAGYFYHDEILRPQEVVLFSYEK